MKEEKVVNSVQQIEKGCNDLLEQAEQLSFMDVSIAEHVVREILKELIETYDNTPEDTQKINKIKMELETNAIKLEYFVQARCGKFKERYQLRMFAENFMEDIHQLFHYHVQEKKTNDNDLVVSLASYSMYAIRLRARAQHILFELTEEDESFIKTVIRKMQLLQETMKLKTVKEN